MSRRLLLIIPVISVIWWSVFEPARDVWYIPPVAFISGFAILYNIPVLVRFLHMKPFYYEDLECININNSQDVNNRFKFQNWFTIIVTFFQSVAFCIVLDYIVYSFRHSNLDFRQQVSFIGGALTLYTSIQDKVGKLLLYIIIRHKQKINIVTQNQCNNLSSDTTEHIEQIDIIELVDLKVADDLKVVEVEVEENNNNII